MSGARCNGWSNSATWTVNLWFGDSWAYDAERGDTITAEYCRDHVQEYAENILGENALSGFIWDMLDLGSVDWEELAAHHAQDEEGPA